MRRRDGAKRNPEGRKPLRIGFALILQITPFDRRHGTKRNPKGRTKRSEELNTQNPKPKTDYPHLPSYKKTYSLAFRPIISYLEQNTCLRQDLFCGYCIPYSLNVPGL
ncbi:MAG: hypothetical protein K8R63_06800 [Bacteroidales bacterium]|nr:hypothetical protein [Bacteroidales bacterium]